MRVGAHTYAMDYTEAKHRIEQLKAILWENSRKYYVENAPTMSDYEYDQLMHELEDWERRYPQYATPAGRYIQLRYHSGRQLLLF